MQQRRPVRVTWLVLATVLAAAGAVLVLVGVGYALRGDADAPPIGAASAVVATPAPATPASPSVAPSSTPGASGPFANATVDPHGPVTLVGAGDIARCDGQGDEATAAQVAALPGLVFTLGDNAYDSGSSREFSQCFDPSWGALKDRIAFPVAGNHDWITDRAAGYRAYFGDAAVRDGTTWYSRDVGTWHVIVLDSDCGKVGGCSEGSAQLAWLRDDLAKSDAACTIALWHHPRFSSGDHGSDRSVEAFWDALYAAGAEVVLNGHDHDYERFAPQDPQGREATARGLVELVVGTGGAELRGFDDIAANSRVRSTYGFGVVSLTLSQSGWTWDYRTTDGGFRDTGSGTCH